MPNLKKENTAKNIKNFIPYGTDPEKDKMVKSGDWEDRLEMAKEGYGLDVLINDENGIVRVAVADQGYGLGILVNDEDYDIRAAVAKQGYGLDILINDEDCDVRKAVLNYLKDNNLTLAEWCNQNNKEIDLKNLAYSPYPEARVAAIKSGYVYKESEMYIAPDCKFTPYGTDPEKDKMVKSDYVEDRLEMAKGSYGLDILINDEDWKIRRAVAKQGYGLNILVNDKDWFVREAVAKQGYGLQILINDKNWGVRETVAEQGYGLDVLINDEAWSVRTAVAEQGYGLDVLIEDKNWKVRRVIAEQGYGLDILVNDKHYYVRSEVAEQGYGLDVLINDESWSVRHAVEDYLTSHNLTLEQWKSNQNLSKTDIINQAKNAINDGNIDIKNVADNINSTKSILNDSINKINKTNKTDKSL